MKTLLSSESLYDCNLEDDFDNVAWEDEKEYFNEFLANEIKSFEKRYNTTVLEIALCGSIGLWNKRIIGGKITSLDNLFYMGDSQYEIEVELDDDNFININAHHHDGCHNLGIYFITNSVLKDTKHYGRYVNEGRRALDADFFEKLYEVRTPLKIKKNNGYYNLETVSA